MKQVVEPYLKQRDNTKIKDEAKIHQEVTVKYYFGL